MRHGPTWSVGEQIYGSVYLRPGHIDPRHTIDTLSTLFEMDVEVVVPFIVVAARRDGLVRVRPRHLGDGEEPDNLGCTALPQDVTPAP